MLTLLALKLLLAPCFIVAASLVGRRFGARVGGVIGGLPVIAGPILLVLAVDHGRVFVAGAATGTILGVIALTVFVLAYVRVSRSLAWPAALLCGWASFLVIVVILRFVHVGPLVAACAACAACATTLMVLPYPQPEAVSASVHPRWDLPLRAACALVLVLLVTGAAGALGSHLSGLLAAFPIITAVLAAFTHAQRGAAEVARLLHGFTVGFIAYALFCFTVSVSVRGLGIAASFALASFVALGAQGGAIALTRRHERALLDHGFA